MINKNYPIYIAENDEVDLVVMDIKSLKKREELYNVRKNVRKERIRGDSEI